jgi:hypothetical protein
MYNCSFCATRDAETRRLNAIGGGSLAAILLFGIRALRCDLARVQREENDRDSDLCVALEVAEDSLEAIVDTLNVSDPVGLPVQ